MKRALLALSLLATAALPTAVAHAADPLTAPGRVVIPAGGFAVANTPDGGGGPVSVATPDGGVVFFGDPDGGGRALVKLLRDGRLDESFGPGGTVRLPASVAAGSPLELRRDAQGRFVLVLQGPARSLFETGQFRVARFFADGSLDASFGTGGVSEPGVQVGCGCASIGIGPDGALFLAGQTGSIDPAAATQPNAPRRFRWVVARLTPAGALDPTFGDKGIATLPGEPASGFMASVLQDGRVVTTGQVGDSPTPKLQIARLLPTGALDTSYGQDGLVTSPFGYAFHWIVDPDGTVTLEGKPLSFFPATGSSAPAQTQLVRFTPAGAADGTFGTGGIVRFEAMDVVRLVREGDRDTLVLGSPGLTSPTLRSLRLSAAGAVGASATITPAFGGGIGGLAGSGFLSRNSFDVSDVLRRPDGSLLLVGGVGVVRYTGEGEGFSAGGFAFAAVTPAFVLDRGGFGGAPTAVSVTAAFPRQRAASARRRGRVLVEVRATRPSLVRVRVRIRGRTVAQEVVSVFRTGLTRYPVRVLRGRTAGIRAGRRVTVTVTVRNLVAQQATVVRKGRLR